MPIAPKRVVSLDSNGALQVSLEVGAPLIASETLDGASSTPPCLPAPPKDFQSLGFNQLNLERLAGLAPDLVIGNLQRVKENYSKLSEIAPTVPYENAGAGVSWQDSIRLISGLLGEQDQIDRGLEEYAARAAAVKSRHGTSLGTVRIALVRFTADELRIIRGQIFGATILDQVGAIRTASTQRKGGKDTYLPVDRENVGLLSDAEVIMYFRGGGSFDNKVDQSFKSYTEGGSWDRGLESLSSECQEVETNR